MKVSQNSAKVNGLSSERVSAVWASKCGMNE